MKATGTRSKRKDIDRVNDDFSDFSLSSPATKMRRLDVELPTIIEDEESERSLPVWPPTVTMGGKEAGEELEMEAPAVNDERAIVVFKPVNGHLLHHRSPSSFSVSVDSDLISGFKNQFPWSSTSAGKGFLVNEAGDDDNDSSNGKCMAVVPWIPSQFPPAPEVEIIESEVMETEDAGEGAMEVEEDHPPPDPFGQGVDQNQSGYEGFQQWQQQHCMTPQFPQTLSTPIVWYR